MHLSKFLKNKEKKDKQFLAYFPYVIKKDRLTLSLCPTVRVRVTTQRLLD
jgi:hypothetical protein